jgi:DNA repair exonuclease SbcCD ATPase subunit
MTLTRLKDKFLQLSGRRKGLQEELTEIKAEITRMEDQNADFIRAQSFFTELSEKTQSLFRGQVESLATIAVRSVFDRPYTVKLISEKRRGRIETEIVILENGEEFQPKDEMGGSMMDLLSFVMRVILWSLQSPRSRNLFVLDEPMKFLGTGERLQHAGRMLSEISGNLNCQLIIVTHSPELAELANTAYMIHHNGVESVVELIKQPKPVKIKRRAGA